MKNSNTYVLVLWTMCLLVSVSCSKTSSSAPTLTLASPLVDDQFTNGQVITIKGETSDDGNLNALNIKITDDKTGAVLYSNELVVNNMKTYGFNVAWTAKVSDWTDATLTVTSVNQDEVKTVKTVKIKIWL